MQWVPWLLAAGNVSSAFCTGKGLNAGWVLLVLTQLGFIVYAVMTGQPGFLLQNVAMIAIGVYNFMKWRRKERREQDEGGRSEEVLVVPRRNPEG